MARSEPRSQSASLFMIAVDLMTLALIGAIGCFLYAGVGAWIASEQHATRRTAQTHLHSRAGTVPTRAFDAASSLLARDRLVSSVESAWQVVPEHDNGGGSTGLARGIHPLSATQFVLDRTTVEELLEEAETMRPTRLADPPGVPKVAGIIVQGIRSDAPLAQLGLRNGDRLETINGYDVTTPEGALEAYSHLRDAPNLRVTLNRAGSPLTFDYSIQ